MSKIRIKNFGPIKEGYQLDDGFMDIKKITVLIGNNGTGKSTIAKLISTFSWMEKALVRGDFTIAEACRKNKFENTYCAYQGLKGFFSTNTLLTFLGEAYDFDYFSGRLYINQRVNIHEYETPKIMYVPAERNFVSSVETPEKLKYLPPNLYEFLDEYMMARQEYLEPIELPFNNLKFQFSKNKGGARIMGDGFNISLSEASSGIQSAIPLFIVSRELAKSIGGEPDASKKKSSVKEAQRRRQRIEQLLKSLLTDEEFMKEIELLAVSRKDERFQNIVEEIEQNLFPSTQKSVLFSLIGFSNQFLKNTLVLTTHSPYIINYISISIQAGSLLKKIIKSNKLDLFKGRLKQILPINACLEAEHVVVYEMNDDGIVIKLPSYDGIPSDKNYLNQSLAEGNKMFDQLLELEEEL